MSDGELPAREPLGPADYARSCVESLVRGERLPQPPRHPLYGHAAACFVSIKKDGELRGCIGTLTPAEPDLGREIMRNARSASLKDPRFAPVREEELSALALSVDILSPSQPCTYADLDPAHYGVIVRAGWRRGVLLPDLKGVDSVEVQVGIARQKAGIPDREPFDLERFRVTRCVEGESADAVYAADSAMGDRGTAAEGEVDA